MPSATRIAFVLSAAGSVLATSALLAAPACSSSNEVAPPAVDAGAADDAAIEAAVTGDGLAPPPIDRTQGEGELGPKREACTFKAGAWPAETIGTDYPVGADIPINHVIV